VDERKAAMNLFQVDVVRPEIPSLGYMYP